MVKIIYEDSEILVAEKPAGLESQASRKFEPDMVSEIRNYLVRSQKKREREQRRELSTKPSTSLSTPAAAPYVGVIHRLDKPVEGIMVYGLNQKSAASLSAALQAGKMEKTYLAVVCGKPVDKQGTYVDYLRHYRENNTSRIVDKSDGNSKKAVLNYRVLEVINNPGNQEQMLSLIDIELLTGRHHQIRVQFAGHDTPLYGDERYGGGLSTKSTTGTVDRGRKRPGFGDRRGALALCARRLVFPHPTTGERMEFAIVPSSGAFAWFPDRAEKLISGQDCGKCHKEV